jgi:hypothetical protein
VFKRVFSIGTCQKSCWIWARPHSSQRGTFLGEPYPYEPVSNLYTETNILYVYTVKKGDFPIPMTVGMSLTKLSLAGISDIPAEYGKMLIFLQSSPLCEVSETILLHNGSILKWLNHKTGLTS